MSYIIFARKFRPQRFEEVVGQEAIARTLQNSIREKKIAQSFLFSGPRGVGKTSLARILAKALNCAKGIVPDPCGDCLSCVEITEGRSLDVLEIDGASNRGIEEIRNLREHVKYKATQGRFKVYIIDEVHMLTEPAFNALLKTLEEPPEHVKFVFATTELHKVPLTITSRCQKYAFARLPLRNLVEKLKEIARCEKIECEEASFHLMARLAEGSLRDAESLLEQLSSFTRGRITQKEALEALGLAPEESYFSMMRALQKRDPSQVLKIYEKLVEEGKDLVQWVRGLLDAFRNLMIVQMLDEPGSLVDVAPESLAEYRKLQEGFTRNEILAILPILQNVLAQAKRSSTPQMLIEMTLLQLAIREELVSVGDLLKELEQIEARISSLPSRVETREKKKQNLAREEAGPTDFQGSLAPTGFTIDQVEAVWPQLIERVKQEKISTGIFLSEAEPVEVEGNQITFGFPPEFRLHQELLEREENKALIRSSLEKLLQTGCSVRFVVMELDRGEKPLEAAPEEEKVPDIVEAALKIFNGKIVRS